MKNLILLLSLSIFLIVSCKKNDNNPNDTGTVLLEQTVTSEGATLTSGIFTVEIPKNAFVEATTITLSKISDSPFGTDQKSEVYFVNNLPDKINVPIILSLSGFSSDDGITTFIAEKTYIKSLNEETFGYRYTPHVFTDGKLQISLNMGAMTGKKSVNLQPGTDSPTSVGATAVTMRHQQLSSGGHFRINSPVVYAVEADKLLPHLEDAFTKFMNSPYSLSYAKRTKWPVEVTIRGLKTGVYGICEASSWGDNSNFLEFNSDKLSDEAAMHITAGHEFMHFVQFLYDPRWSFTKAHSEPHQLWLDEATSVWAEYMFTPAKDYFSTVRKGNEMAPFAALRKGKEDKAQDYGYGMSALIKYLVDKQGEDIILKINEQITKGEKPAEAIRLATDKSYWEWYGYFIDQYVRGNLYKDVDLGSLVSMRSDEFDIKTATDLNKESVSDYGQLQTKIYITTINPDALTDNSSLNFKIKSPDNEMINVYKYKNQTIEYIGQNFSNIGNVSVPGIKKIAQDGYKIMTVVTNTKYDYTSDAKQNITLVTSLAETGFYIGQSYGGGIIAYILQPGDPGYTVGQTHALIVAPSDKDGLYWYIGAQSSYKITGATETAIGSGNANTNLIVGAMGEGSYAAKYCYDLKLNGFNDWYLPSRDELHWICRNKVTVEGFSNSTYWSSSEVDVYEAWGQANQNCYKEKYDKYFQGGKVRAIRSF